MVSMSTTARTGLAPSDVRANNIAAAFDLLFPATQMSRAQIGKTLGLSRMATSEVTAEMLDDHIVREIGADTRSGRGKRSMVLAIDSAYWRVIALDLSQPYVFKGAVLDLCGRIVERAETPYDDAHVHIEGICALIQRLISMSTQPVLGIGIAVPGIIGADGEVIRSVPLNMSHVNIRDRIQEAFQLPVIVCNDTSMELVAERYFGDGSANSMLIHIGQGVGASLCLDNELVNGQDFMAGEIGHIVVDPSGPACECGKHGCLEAMLSTKHLNRLIDDDPAARTDILARAGTLLGQAMAFPVGLLNLHDIAIYGPANLIGDIFLNAMHAELEARAGTEYFEIPSLHRCQQGEDLALRGQAVAVIQELIPTIRNTSLDS